MNHKEAYKALTGVQFNRKNEAYAAGWRLHNEGHKITVNNVKTGEEHVGYREMTKAMTWGKRINWQD